MFLICSAFLTCFLFFIYGIKIGFDLGTRYEYPLTYLVNEIY